MKCSERHSANVILQASYDIETYSYDGSFPQPEEEPNVIFQIATTFQRLGEDAPYHRHLATLGGCDDIEGTTVVRCKDEMEVLLEWRNEVHRERTDALIGYNTSGFDNEYIYKRGDLYWSDDERWDEFRELGKLTGKLTTLVDHQLSSAAYGTQTYRFFNTPGILQLDLCSYLRKEFKFSSYTLDAVSQELLGETKVDLKPQEMFIKFKGSDTDRMEIGEYCVQVGFCQNSNLHSKHCFDLLPSLIGPSFQVSLQAML